MNASRVVRSALMGIALFFGSLHVSAAGLVVPAGATVTLPSGSLNLGCADLVVQGVLSAGNSTMGGIGNVTIAASATLDGGGGTLTVGGNWANGGTFARGTSTVVLADGCTTAPAQLTGSTTFANLTLASAAGRTFVLPVGSSTAVTGALVLTGAPGLPIQVVSADPSLPTSIALLTGASVTSTNATVASNVTVAPPLASFAFAPSALAFAGQSMQTTSPPLAITITNTGTGTLTVNGIATSSPQFAQTNNCASLAAAAICTVDVTFTPAAAAGALNATVAVSATLDVSTTEAGTGTVPLSGTAEKSLVSHYYRSILRRAPDDGGKAFWNGEATRVQALGLNVNEVWFSMAQTFYTSGEYLAFGRDNTGFVTDLFNTFFNRAPDAEGLAYWQGQVDQGLPREVALVAFMFSTEFSNFTTAIFGNTAVRAEINTVTDFYRGLLSRLPDDGGFAFWLAKFRAAQCGGASAGNAVNTEAESISSLFATSQEYANRARNNSQYVGDLYNAFLRRGGDLGGVQFWIDEVASNRRSRENVRQAFVASSEFQSRVAAVIAAGCAGG